MLQGFHHAAISTPDLARALRFYQGVLGCETVREFGWPTGIAAADALTSLKTFPPASTPQWRKYWHMFTGSNQRYEEMAPCQATSLSRLCPPS